MEAPMAKAHEQPTASNSPDAPPGYMSICVLIEKYGTKVVRAWLISGELIAYAVNAAGNIEEIPRSFWSEYVAGAVLGEPVGGPASMQPKIGEWTRLRAGTLSYETFKVVVISDRPPRSPAIPEQTPESPAVPEQKSQPGRPPMHDREAYLEAAKDYLRSNPLPRSARALTEKVGVAIEVANKSEPDTAKRISVPGRSTGEKWIAPLFKGASARKRRRRKHKSKHSSANYRAR
jgi:hypothetical protein